MPCLSASESLYFQPCRSYPRHKYEIFLFPACIRFAPTNALLKANSISCMTNNEMQDIVTGLFYSHIFICSPPLLKMGENEMERLVRECRIRGNTAHFIRGFAPTECLSIETLCLQSGT